MKKRYPSYLNMEIPSNINYNELKINNTEIGNNLEDKVINEAYKAIEYGIKTKQKTAEIFQIWDTRAVINIPKTEWKKTLNDVILPFFIKKENYDICCNIRDLIKMI